jgi:hypothetical protein
MMEPFTSDKDDWCTPPKILDYVYEFFPGGIRLDPCSNSASLVVALNAMDGSPGKNGLEANWYDIAGGYHDDSGVFVNPPYGKTMPLWINKIVKESDDLDILALIPARTSNKWWKTIAATGPINAAWVCFIQQRVTFVGAKSGAPFPSAMVYWGHDGDRFCDVFNSLGPVFTRTRSFTQRQERRNERLKKAGLVQG